VQNVPVAESSVPKSEVQGREAAIPSTNLQTALQKPMPENGPDEMLSAQSADVAGQQEHLQKVKSATPQVSSAPVAIAAADGRVETAVARPDLREPGKVQLKVQADESKNIIAAAPLEKQAGGEGNETPDRGMGGNFQSQLLHQQLKPEGPTATAATSAAAQSAAPRADLPPEQVVQQVRDRLVNHEAKPGSEQIVLRLSPEHLGELKVNLNLEGQRLKVEIVAENRMVRDSLMQHTDSLKESLSRQNIKMDSFEVTTGGNGSADSGRGQGEWRELAQRRQQNAWMPDGGYRMAKQAVPAAAAYLARSEHTMVDLHY
jgi:flagellar hook-length control protein FliK